MHHTNFPSNQEPLKTPLQNHLERIHECLKKEEILKARVLATALPIFDALECVYVLKKICFYLIETPKESLYHLALKLNLLFLNIIVSIYDSGKSPEFIYRFHKYCGLLSGCPTVNRKIISKEMNPEEIKDEAILNPADLEEVLTEVAREKSPSSKTSTFFVKDPPAGSSTKVQQFIKQLQTAPRKYERNTSFQDIRKDIKTRGQTISMRGKNRKKPHTYPSSKDTLNSLEKLFLNPKEEPKKEEENLSKNVEQRFLPQIDHLTEKPFSIDDARFASIKVLINSYIQQKGSLRVSNQQIAFTMGKLFHLDPAIIDVLAQAQAEGILTELPFDQTLILIKNVDIILSFLQTVRHDHFDKCLSLTKQLHKQAVLLWIQNDFNEENFYLKCQALLNKLMVLIKMGKGQQANAHERLFEERSTKELFNLLEDWQLYQITRKPKLIKTFTIYDYYELLEAYLSSIPLIKEQWKPLTQAMSKEGWKQTFLELEKPEQQIIFDIIKMFSQSLNLIWKNDLKGMLKGANTIADLIFPIDLEMVREILNDEIEID